MNKQEKSLLTELYWIIEENKSEHHLLYYSKDILGSILRGEYGVAEKLIQRKKDDMVGKPRKDTLPRIKKLCPCGSGLEARWSADPYQEDIYGVTEMGWMCDVCYQLSCDEI